MTTENEGTIHDELRESLASLSADNPGDPGSDVPPAEPAEAPAEEPPAAVARDSAGRFAAKAEEPADAPAEPPKKLLTDPDTDPTADVETGRWTADKPPSSWTPKVRERWNEIDPEIRQEIIRREEAAVNGVRRLQEQFGPVERFINKLNPLMQELVSQNIPVEEHVSRVLTAERGLRSPDVPSRFQALLGLADQYGIPLREVVNASVGQQILQPPAQPSAQHVQLPPDVQQEIEYLRQSREQAQHQFIETQVNSFAESHEFFDDVRFEMGQLISSGLAQNMDDAYAQAIWMVPTVREVLVAREQAAQAKSAVASRQAAAARVATPGVRASAPEIPSVDTDEDDIYSAVRQAAVTLSRRV